MRNTFRSWVALVALAFAVRVGFAQAPDFSNVSDFLRGQRTLLKISDIAVMAQRPTPGNGNSWDLNLSTFLSNNSKFAGTAAGTGLRQAGANFATSVTAFGRFWEGPTETAAVAFQVNSSNAQGLVLDLVGNSPGDTISQFAPTMMVPGDFTGDGYTDLAIAFESGYFVIASASDVTKPSIPRWGPIPQNTSRPYAMAAADVNGDGTTELVVVEYVYLNQLGVRVYSIDPITLTPTSRGAVTLNTGSDGTYGTTDVSIALGSFRGDSSKQALIASAYQYRGANLSMVSFSDLQPQQVDMLPASGNPNGTFLVKAARLISSQPYDQALFFFSGLNVAAPQGSRNKYIQMVGIDPATLKLSLPAPFADISQIPCVYDLAIGNYDQQVPDPLNAGATEPSLDQQIAYISGDCSPGANINLDVITFNSDLTMKSDQVTAIANPAPGATALSLVAGDTQGRSYVLGEPAKIEMNSNVQTSVVAAAPPSHVDYIVPPNGGRPVVMNISAMPEGFQSAYNTSQKSTNQSSTTSGTSWSFGAAESVNAYTSIGDVDEGDGAEVKVSASAAQDLKKQSDTTNSSYASTSFDVSSSSSTGDNFWFNSSRLNLWVYPVLGRKVCPQATPNCTDAQKVPQVVTYSAPDNITNESTTQDVSSIYQPPWEYGNLLSYPNNFQQLSQVVPNIALLSQASQPSFNVSGGPLTINANWTSGGASGSTSSFTQNYSFDASIAVQGAVGFQKIFTVGGGYNIDISGSYGLSNQTSGLNQIDTSTGLSISKPGGFLDPALYGYTATPYIFARSKPATVDDSSKAPTTQVAGFGALRSAFTADIVSTSAGGFWRQAYAIKPDVGLSHPSRWELTEGALQTPPPLNCRPSGLNNSQQDCFDVHEHLPGNPWISPSLFMQGFFVTNAQDNVDPTKAGPGPNLSVTTAGTQVTLQARIYNFSMANFPAGTSVHVQFYGMPWNTNINQPAGPNSSFKIGPKDPVTGKVQDIVLGAIPPLTAGNGLNWVYASANLDTTTYAGQYLVFWVVVWAESSTGGTRTLVSEIAGHGLSSIPPDQMTDMTQVPVEMNANVDASAMVTYSNNLGFYRSVFFVAPPPTPPSTANFSGVSAFTTDPGPRLKPVELSRRTMATRDDVEVAVPVTSGDKAVQGDVVRFYDGHPDDGGQLIRVEHLHYIAPHSLFEARVLYRPAKPGLRRIWAFLNKGTSRESVRASDILCVGKSCTYDILGAAAEESSEKRDPREKP